MSPTRLGIILVSIGALIAIATIGTFSFFFYDHNISKNVNDWGAFGSYLGGALGTPISVLALIGSVIAIYRQHLADQRENKQSVASDLLRSIERLDDSIEKNLKEMPIIFNMPGTNFPRVETNAYRLLTEFHHPMFLEEYIPKFNNDPDSLSSEFEKLTVSNSTMELLESLNFRVKFASICGQLRLLNNFIAKHNELSGHNAISIYYHSKYKGAVKKLIEAGYPIEIWDSLN